MNKNQMLDKIKRHFSAIITDKNNCGLTFRGKTNECQTTHDYY